VTLPRGLPCSVVFLPREVERGRIARETHNDSSQRPALQGTDIAKQEKHSGTPRTALPLLRTMQEPLGSLSEDVHNLARRLHPSIRDNLGLARPNLCPGLSWVGTRSGFLPDARASLP
jgi:hypothetical protein